MAEGARPDPDLMEICKHINYERLKGVEFNIYACTNPGCESAQLFAGTYVCGKIYDLENEKE